MTTTQPTEETTMRVPPSPDATTPTDRTPEPVRGRLIGTVDGVPVIECDDPQVAAYEAYMETITDRAAIRDSDEADDVSLWRKANFPLRERLPVSGVTDVMPRAATRIVQLAHQVDLLTARAELAEDALRLRSDALARVTREAEALRAVLSDLAQHGTRHDLHPTHRAGDEAFWHRYIDRMDEGVRRRAEAALATTGEGK